MDNPGSSGVLPLWDAEFARAECPRRVWDKYTGPSYGYKKIAAPANNIVEYPVDDFWLNSSEDLARNNVKKYNDHWSKRGGQGLSSICVGGAKIIFCGWSKSWPYGQYRGCACFGSNGWSKNAEGKLLRNEGCAE